MSEEGDLPILTDLIEKGIEIKMSDLGLDEDTGNRLDDPDIDATEIDMTEPNLGAIDPFRDNPALEQTIRRILDEHLELAWQEIKLAIQRDLNK